MSQVFGNGRHLSVGSTAPPLTKGKLRLYSMRFCPYAQRVHLVLDAKKIPYDVVNVNLSAKPEWLFDKHPLGKVPAIEFEDGTVLYESLVLCEYLDSISTTRPLASSDPLQRAKDKLVIERFSQFIVLFYKMYQDINALNSDDVLQSLEEFEIELTKRDSPYFSGTRPGMVDFMIWPWCERADMLTIMAGDRFSLPEKRFPKLLQWKKFMKEDEAVKCSYLDVSDHVKFLKSRLAGTNDYDMLVASL
ncbi:Glutathione-S-transferase omega 1-like [Frankliniella occidentalis]|uniref:Pyrimidodiazepine synthase n=1 Tax=Frankliniella occidentalis TaxID=133901 RepID=A0A6J1SQ89_FRAOC|nr:pyrimidodiazepine synthase [Frankliniella occidentalis]XP_026283435.1 pyrimidodiazepine synthase [Frankliniella occidentalis]XP_026283437.1 pyrimidodiazepine synthase [Frankliniella occidentalis]XP_026283439.1 pyrimidodiazepine synthase [Frankliniella occidentalis]KAE8743804.1 Glutathione-S-transferase omega 1-like [Frankliniella occidentalis]